MKITHLLVNKIYQDLVWWKNLSNTPTQKVTARKNEQFKDENQNWGVNGLDHKSLD